MKTHLTLKTHIGHLLLKKKKKNGNAICSCWQILSSRGGWSWARGGAAAHARCSITAAEHDLQAEIAQQLPNPR